MDLSPMVPSISFGSDEISFSGEKLSTDRGGLPIKPFQKSDVKVSEFKDS